MIETRVERIEDILDQVTGFWRTAILQAALDLQVADHVAAGRVTSAAIAEAEKADPRGVTVLLDALCGMGLLDKVVSKYHLKPLVEQVLPMLGRVTPAALDADNFTTWARLSDAIRSGKPLGAKDDYWENYSRSTRQVARLQGMMAVGFVQIGDGARILDVGCGSGGVGYAIALAFPGVTVTGIDSESVLSVAADYANELGISDRVTLRPLDILKVESLGEGEFDLAILGNILHLFDPPTNRAVLAKLGRSLVPGGAVLINEILPDDERRREAYPLMFAVELFLRTPGGTAYTFAEIASWLAEAGFEEVQRQSTMAYVTTITAVKH